MPAKKTPKKKAEKIKIGDVSWMDEFEKKLLRKWIRLNKAEAIPTCPFRPIRNFDNFELCKHTCRRILPQLVEKDTTVCPCYVFGHAAMKKVAKTLV